MSALLDRCPSCHGELAGSMETHCPIEGRKSPCGWVRHRCDSRVRAVIDPRLGRYYMEAVVRS